MKKYRKVCKKGWRKKRSRLKRSFFHGSRLKKKEIIKYHLRYFIKKKYFDPELLKYCTFNKLRNKLYPKKRLELVLPDNFSFIESHEETSKFLDDLERALSYKIPYDVDVVHQYTNNIDLAASHLFDEMIINYKDYWKKKRVFIRFAGNVSRTNKSVNNFLLAFGLLKRLGIKKISSDVIDHDYMEKYEIHKFAGRSDEEHLAGNASTQLADYFDSCLKHNGFKFKSRAKEKFAGTISEIICNAEEHGGENPVLWHTLGCYNKETHQCSFAIINSGKTIAETLRNSEHNNVPQVIDDKMGFFKRIKNYFNSSDNKETILNLIALQDGISSKRPDTFKGKASTRGQGLMTLLEYIDLIGTGDGDTIIAVLSGKSKLLIDFHYPINYFEVTRNGETHTLRRIAFNEECEIFSEQDKKYAMSIDKSYPGTIFSGKFIIKEDYLDKITKKD